MTNSTSTPDDITAKRKKSKEYLEIFRLKLKSGVIDENERRAVGAILSLSLLVDNMGTRPQRVDLAKAIHAKSVHDGIYFAFNFILTCMEKGMDFPSAMRALLDKFEPADDAAAKSLLAAATAMDPKSKFDDKAE